MKTQTITIENKKYCLIPQSEYLDLKADINDLKKIFARRNEAGVDAKSFFNELASNRKEK